MARGAVTIGLAAAVALVAVPARPCAGQVLRYTVRNIAGRTELTSVTVKRGEVGAVYDPARLIAATVTHFKAASGVNIIVPAGAPVPKGAARTRLLDTVLNSGLINPGGRDTPPPGPAVLTGSGATPGMAVAFSRPVVNLPGPDIVLFEMQRRIASPLGGDPVRILPPKARPGLRALTIRTFDVPFGHASARVLLPFDGLQADRPPQNLAELLSRPFRRAFSHDDFKALATGIDLSALGYGPGEKVAGLFLQNARSAGAAVDPVCLVGLPAPKPPNLLAKEPKAVEVVEANLLAGALAGPLANVEDIVFAVRVPGTDHWYANFGYYAAPCQEYPPQREPDGVTLRPIYRDGGRLCALNVRTGRVRTLLNDPQGSIRDPQVHYDGRKILFSYRKSGQAHFHLYEVRTDGSGLTQLTAGAWNDIEPTYLPDGGVMFCSDRCRRFVNCWLTPVATLYGCDADGRNVRMLSPNIEHDNTPWPMPDGRVLYMRWEYVDRSQLLFHHLWTTNPDGTNQTVYFGNMHGGTAMLDAKPIPPRPGSGRAGTNRVVASFSPGHGRPEHAGYVTVVDPGRGPDARSSARRISRGGPVYRDPYPLSGDLFLVARDRRLMLMDAAGNTDTLYELPAGGKRVWLHEPRPIARRPREAPVPSRVDLQQHTGRLLLDDVYHGRNMASVRRGHIARLLILAQLPKPVNFSGGPWPISNGGTFTLARILGTVPVADDGSAYFEVPAMQPVFFVALDDRDLSVKRMQSFVSVQPGEVTGCVGCHETRTSTPPAAGRRPAAARRPPSRIEPVTDVPDVLDFHRDVQPVLDRHCVRCHSPNRYDGRVDLVGNHTPLFCNSYWTIIQRGLIADGRNALGNRAPYSIGSSASRLMKLLDGSHYKAKPTAREVKTVRLWIESSAVYAGTYAALGSGFATVRFPVAAMTRRCGDCHGHPPRGKPIGGHKTYFRFGKKGPAVPLVHSIMHLRDVRAGLGYFKFGYSRSPQSLCNLDDPPKSLLLRAPLAKTAGGLAICERPVFQGTDDADYKAILAAITEAGRRLRRHKRFDMPGFRPNDYYCHQMQRYGILPEDLPPDKPIDPFATDRAYWQLFHYAPVRQFVPPSSRN